MNEKRVEEIKNAIRELIKALVQRGTPLSEELKIQLARVIEYAAERIQELRSQEIPKEVPTQSELVPGGYPSSNVNAFKYDPKTKRLFVQFHGPYPQAEGPVYSYADVPDYLFDVISRGAVGPKTSGKNKYHAWNRGITPSLGASVNALLKAGGFSYQRVG